MFVYEILKLDIAESQSMKLTNYILMRYPPAVATLFANYVHRMLDFQRHVKIPAQDISFIVVMRRTKIVKTVVKSRFPIPLDNVLLR